MAFRYADILSTLMYELLYKHLQYVSKYKTRGLRYRVNSPNMRVVPNMGYRSIFPVCFHHLVVSMWPCSRGLVTPFVRRTGFVEEGLLQLWTSICFRARQSFGESFFVRLSVAQGRYFNSTIILISVLVTTMYLVLLVFDSGRFPGRHYSPEIPGREQRCEFSHLLTSRGQVHAPVN